MDSAYFTKLAKDCQLLDSKVTSTDVDLIFVKVKDMQEKRITYDQVLLAAPRSYAGATQVRY